MAVTLAARARATRPLPEPVRRLATPEVGRRVLVWGTIAMVLVIGGATVDGMPAADSTLGVSLLSGSLVASSVAVALAGRSPRLASALAAVPFLWLLAGTSSWVWWWLFAQLAVLALTAFRSWRAAVVPALGSAVAFVLVLDGVSTRWGPSERSGTEEHWVWIHLFLLVGTLVVAAALGVLARAGVMEQVLSTRATALTRAGAVQSERARLAADLHDVVAHHVSLIAVRAGTAPYSEPSIEPASREVLAEIAGDARRALDELRGVLGVLHRADTSPELAPQPSIRDLPDLVLRSTRAGDRVSAEGVDAPWIVPDTVGYVVYRVVQEALTNARRHAQGGLVELGVGRDGDELEVSVSNEPGRSTVPPGSDAGEGLVSMAERVQGIGGYLVAGPTADGGFRVTARVPVADARR